MVFVVAVLVTARAVAAAWFGAPARAAAIRRWPAGAVAGLFFGAGAVAVLTGALAARLALPTSLGWVAAVAAFGVAGAVSRVWWPEDGSPPTVR
jgi:hypothetical protein